MDQTTWFKDEFLGLKKLIFLEQRNLVSSLLYIDRWESRKARYSKLYNIYIVIQVSFTAAYGRKTKDIGQVVAERHITVPSMEREEHVLDELLCHWKRQSGFQFLILMKGDAAYDSVWTVTENFVNYDGIVSEHWKNYTWKHGILLQLHWQGRQ